MPSPAGKAAAERATYLVAAGHDDMLWLGHDTALLGHQCVLGVAREPVGGEEPIVLLHTEWLPRQLALGTVGGDGVAGEQGERKGLELVLFDSI